MTQEVFSLMQRAATFLLSDERRERRLAACCIPGSAFSICHLVALFPQWQQSLSPSVTCANKLLSFSLSPNQRVLHLGSCDLPLNFERALRGLGCVPFPIVVCRWTWQSLKQEATFNLQWSSANKKIMNQASELVAGLQEKCARPNLSWDPP